MKAETIVEHLEEAVRRLGYRLRVEKGDFRGGKARVFDESVVFVNRRMSYEERAETLARVLARESLDDVYLLPEVREFVERFNDEEDRTAAVSS